MEGGRYALLIGTWHYQNDQLPDLASPARDVRDLAAVLADPHVGAFASPDVLENKTAHEIRVAIEGFFSDRLHGDLLVLYFSGHGLKNEHGRFYFAARDTDPKRLIATGISANFIHEVLQGSRSRKKVILMDSCFGGAVVQGLVVKSVAQITPDELGSDAKGLVILTATDSMTYAFEGGGTPGADLPSVFTKHLVHGLRSGEADLEHDGEVTIGELYEYVREKVKQEVPGQDPKKWEFEAAGDLILAQNPNPSLVLLPKEIQDTIEGWHPAVRVAGIELLISLLAKPFMRRPALAALEQLLNDDSVKVQKAAREALSKLPITIQDLPSNDVVRVQSDPLFPKEGATPLPPSMDGKRPETDGQSVGQRRVMIERVNDGSSVLTDGAAKAPPVGLAFESQGTPNIKVYPAPSETVVLRESLPTALKKELEFSIPETAAKDVLNNLTLSSPSNNFLVEFKRAWMYLNGIGVAQSDSEAAKWYRKAADQDDAAAQFNLGNMYENGRGVSQNYNEAVSWYVRAADQSDARAQASLGRMYENGQGVPKDACEAVKWYRKAADQGNVAAIAALKRLGQ